MIELGSSYRRELQGWGRQRQLLRPDDDSILSVAVAIPKKLPTEKQSAKLLNIKARLWDPDNVFSGWVAFLLHAALWPQRALFHIPCCPTPKARSHPFLSPTSST